MTDLQPAPMHAWLAGPIESKAAAAIERVRRCQDVRHVAVMPDVHYASDVCVGTVVATSQLLFPSAVGGDIGCGMLALTFEAEANVLEDPKRAAQVLKMLGSAIPSMRRHRKRTLEPEAIRLDEPLSHNALQAIARSQGALQMGTLGGGNHFIEFQSDESGRLWLMIHSGSRAMGQAVRGHHLARAHRVSDAMFALDAEAPEGQAYVHDMQWAREYADANRRAMARVISESMERLFQIRTAPDLLITCDHNHVSREEHLGRLLWVHRKGAMAASKGMAGVLPGSMGTTSYHVEGRGCALPLNSSAHGAGRAFSRDAARRKFTARDLCRQMQGVWFDHRLAENLRDEAPRAYKNIEAVLRAQHELIKVVRRLRPLLTYKGC